MKKKNLLIVAIDPGSHTGLATFETGIKQLRLQTIDELHRALEVVDNYRKHYGPLLLVKIENPNLWIHFSKTKNANARLQGAGSIKRDFKIWKQFFVERGIEFEEFGPDKKRNQLAKNTAIFSQLTGYDKRSSHHARCAAMLIYYGRNRQTFIERHGWKPPKGVKA